MKRSEEIADVDIGTSLVSGDSMSSGQMLVQPPNDGSNPPPLGAVDGTFSVTCGWW